MGTHPSNRRGFSLIELLVVIVLMGIVGATLTRVLLNMQRASRAQSERVTLQGNLRAGIAFIPAELRDLSAQDIMVADPDLIEYRAMRAAGVACDVTAAALTLRNALTFQYRDVTPGRDSVFVFVENDPTMGSDDSWIALGIAGRTAGTCPDGAAATVLSVVNAGVGYTAYTAAIAAAQIVEEAPVRTFERMEIGLYVADGRSWLGARSISAGEAAMQPVLGPLMADSGLAFVYQNATGAVTGTLADMRVIHVTLRGETGVPISSAYGGPAIHDDMIQARVRLRNAY